ncbi:hypothetical protein [Bosea sp. RAC05]|jgi:hypothetical protein|uniref:hypothetical protein n=1 Tax=Bosea sp. RAC05 TaxID=1842539 RepID=UPI00083DA8CD|nr:hypothetical protein [Bosea sp. RAC05]AOG05538.1 hypothetical protein BSY19_2100 [Bosea sp. RAC05]
MTQAAECTIAGASCLIFRNAPSWEGRRTASVGRFRCDSVATGRDLLASVATDLTAEGYEALIGPMDGDTWHSYRLVTETDGSPPFLMEPVSGPYDAEAFAAAGFTTLSGYVSTRTTLDAAIAPEPVSIAGVSVQSWDGSDAAGLIRQLYAMSAAAFRNNAFFKPLDEQGFLDLYEPVMPLVDPRFVLFARNEADALVGFLFGMPDRLEGAAPRTVILKTYASAQRGVGHLLADHFHRSAREAGYTQAIHALMHVDNVSLARSARHAGTVFRRYALLGRRLDT